MTSQRCLPDSQSCGIGNITASHCPNCSATDSLNCDTWASSIPACCGSLRGAGESSWCTAFETKARGFRSATFGPRLSGCAIGKEGPRDEEDKFRSLPRRATPEPGICGPLSARGRSVGCCTADCCATAAGEAFSKGAREASEDLAATDQPTRVSW